MGLTFHYRLPGHRAQGRAQPRPGLLHRCNPAVKFLSYLVLSILLSISSGSTVLILFILLFCSAIAVNSDVFAFFRQLRAFLWIFIISYLSRAHLSGGEIITLFPRSLSLSLSWNAPGALAAGFFMLRVMSVLIVTDLLMFSTTAGDLQQGIYFLFSFVHRNAAWRLSIMLRLMLSSIPILMDSAEVSRQALRARGLRQRRRPLAYLRGIGLVIIRVLDRLHRSYARALLARGWNVRQAAPKGRLVLSGSDTRLIISLVLMSALALTATALINHAGSTI